MSKKKSDKKKRPQQRRPTRALHAVPSEPDDDSPHNQPLFQGLRSALREDHPLALLGAVSGLMAVAEEGPSVSMDELVDSFVGVDYAETTAALSVIRALTPDDLLAARIGKVLSTRRQPMPAWIKEIDATQVVRVLEMKHVLGDCDDYFLEAAFPDGNMLTALVYVDHNMGTVVKDAFCIPDSFDVIERTFHEKTPDPDTRFSGADHAETRAVVTEAIRVGAMTFPPLETDTWPMCRPLVEWMLRMLPASGSMPALAEWGEQDLAGLRDDFLASPYAEGLDGADERGLLEDLTRFGSGYAGGDPLRWSPVNVEILLVDWIPRKIIADRAYLSKAPAVLRPFIRYCHHHRGIRQGLTKETLAAVDRWQPEFQRMVAERLDRRKPLSHVMLEHLDHAVGGRQLLMNLGTEPLPDEPFDWSGIPYDIHDRVGDVLELCERCADELFDTEFRTALRRFLGRAAAADPAIFRRKGSTERAAAAVCWAVAKANEAVGSTGSPLVSQELVAWFGVKGSVSQRAEVFLKAIGVNPYQFGSMDLESPDYLVAGRRERIIELRDRYLALDLDI